MFNKDQYDQEQFNSYYEQETEGAEILGGRKYYREKRAKKKIIIGSLLLALASVGGYFGYKNIQTNNITDNNITTDKDATKQSIQEDNKKSNISKSSVREKVEEITNSSDEDAKISPEDIANIVQLVMMKMKEEQESTKEDKKKLNNDIKDEENSSISTIKGSNNDKELITSLSESEVDTLHDEKQDENIKNISHDTTKIVGLSNENDIKDTYNKVVLKKDDTKEDDELSKISNNISDIVENEAKSKDTEKSEYAKKLKEEAKQRKKEMRYIIVKKGDTLGKIAKRVYGDVMAYKKIYKANPDILKRPDKIYIGQKLRVPE